MGEKMANAPIFYTLAQIRFSPILSMGDYVPRIHERLRREFPEVRQEEQRLLQLNLAAGPNSEGVTAASSTRWMIANRWKTAGYILTTDSLVFHTTAYETSAEFRASLLKGIRLVHEIVGLSYIESVGVRTLDAVIPEDGKSLDFYLQSQLLGFYGILDGALQHNITENVTTYPSGRLVSRVLVLRGSLGMPMDLFPIALNLGKRFQDVNGLHAIVDLDHNQQVRFEFDPSEIESRLGLMKQGVTAAFYKSVTDQGLESWK